MPPRPLRVGVLCSHRAPGLIHLLSEDANRGELYDLTCCLTSEDAFEEQAVVAAHGVPIIAHPIRAFCRTHGYRLSDAAGRVAYDRATADRLALYDLDVVVLLSYLYVLSQPMLSSYPQRIINIHHSDLTLRTDDGHALLPGLRAVRDAIRAGLPETRATVHLVTPELDEGPPFLRSWKFPVSVVVRDALNNHSADMLRTCIHAHQEWMIQKTWGPLAAGAIELIGRPHLDLPALATTPRHEIGSPWDLDEEGWIRGSGPLHATEALLRLRRVS